MLGDFVTACLDVTPEGGCIRTCCYSEELTRDDLIRLREFLQKAGY